MDPFGLLNLLKFAVSPETKTEEPQPQPAPSSTLEQDPISPQNSDTPNAFVDFIAEHDARAKRTKKRP